MWQFTGRGRPPFAEDPGPGQESVWDYPRPPALQPDERHVVVRYKGLVIADSQATVRLLETASPPTFYFPPTDVDTANLVLSAATSYCEWKGEAQYWSLRHSTGDLPNVGWSYAQPRAAYLELAGYFSFYPGKLECYVDSERVRPQPGRFYGGWVTNEIIGPIKGAVGTSHW